MNAHCVYIHTEVSGNIKADGQLLTHSSLNCTKSHPKVSEIALSNLSNLALAHKGSVSLTTSPGKLHKVIVKLVLYIVWKALTHFLNPSPLNDT